MASYHFYNNNKKYRSKKRIKNIALSLLLVLALVLPMGMIVSSGAAEWKDINPISWFKHERNPDNLITTESYILDEQTTNGYGINIKLKDDGRMVLNGRMKYEKDKAYYTTFATVTLKAGTYTLSGLDNASFNTYGYYFSVNGAEAVPVITDKQFVIEQDNTPVSIGFYVYDGEILFNKTLAPVLVAGNQAGEFYK